MQLAGRLVDMAVVGLSALLIAPLPLKSWKSLCETGALERFPQGSDLKKKEKKTVRPGDVSSHSCAGKYLRLAGHRRQAR